MSRNEENGNAGWPEDGCGKLYNSEGKCTRHTQIEDSFPHTCEQFRQEKEIMLKLFLTFFVYETVPRINVEIIFNVFYIWNCSKNTWGRNVYRLLIIHLKLRMVRVATCEIPHNSSIF